MENQIDSVLLLRRRGKRQGQDDVGGVDAKKALKKAANPSKYQAARVKELANQQGQAMSQLIQIQADLRHAVFQILTPEQQKQWVSTKQKYKKKHRRPHP